MTTEPPFQFPQWKLTTSTVETGFVACIVIEVERKWCKVFGVAFIFRVTRSVNPEWHAIYWGVGTSVGKVSRILLERRGEKCLITMWSSSLSSLSPSEMNSELTHLISVGVWSGICCTIHEGDATPFSSAIKCSRAQRLYSSVYYEEIRRNARRLAWTVGPFRQLVNACTDHWSENDRWMETEDQAGCRRRVVSECRLTDEAIRQNRQTSSDEHSWHWSRDFT